MSSYPPTPAFGGFTFVPQKPALPKQTDVPPPASLSGNTARRPSTQHSQPSASSTIGAFAGPAAFRVQRAKMNPSGTADESSSTSDSLEEGELSEPQSRDSMVSRNSVNESGDDELRATVDRPPVFEPPGNWNARYRAKSSRAQSGPYQGKNGVQSMRNDRHGATDRRLDASTSIDKRRGFPHSSNGFSRPANGHDLGVAKISAQRLEAEGAILDMRQCGVQFEDLVREGFDPNFLRQMFVRLDLPVPKSKTSSPAISNGQRNGFPVKEVVHSVSQPQSSNKVDPDKEAQILRQKLEKERQEKEKKERLDKERKEAEAKAAELARQREAARQEEERRRREVEVLAKQELFKKKIATMLPQKPASPGMPPTPISSTPVNAAVVEAHPDPIRPATSTPSTQVIPGLLLGQAEQTPKPVGQADVVMKDAPAVVQSQPVTPPVVTSPAVTPPVVTSPAITPPVVTSPAITPPVVTSPVVTPPAVAARHMRMFLPSILAVRRKRPMASDLYTESTVKRKFGAQRSDSLIIEVSEDEDEEAEAGDCLPQEPDRKSPLGTPGITPGGLRRNTVTPSSQAAQQAEALRRTEAEIQRMKEKIMAAQQKKKLSKANTSAPPTPVTTPSIGAGPFVPPSLNGAGKGQSAKPLSLAKLANGTQDLPAIVERRKSEEDNAKKAAEQALREEEQSKAAEKTKAQQILEEKRRMAAKEAEEKREKEEIAKKQEEERERKRKQLAELHCERERKRLAREKLIAEEERLRLQIEEMHREEQDMARRHDSLAKDLEEDQASKKTSSLPAQASNEPLQTEVEAKKLVIEESIGTPLLGTKQTPVEGGSTASVPASMAVSESQPSKFLPHIASDQVQGPVTANGKIPTPRVTAEGDRTSASLPKAPTSAVIEPVDNMDIDDVLAQPNAVETAVSDVEMTSNGEDEDSSSDDSDPSSEESSSDEEEEDDESSIDKSDDDEPDKSLKGPSMAGKPKVADPARASLPVDVENSNTHFAASAKTQKGDDKTKSYTNAFVPYVSPLSIFRSYRHHPQFLELNPNGLRSLQFSNKIDPFKELCKYEASGGVCNDPCCRWQHFRQMTMEDEEILVELAENEGVTEEEKAQYTDGLRDTILGLKQRGEKDFLKVAKGIAAYRRRFFGDETRIVKFNPTEPAIPMGPPRRR